MSSTAGGFSRCLAVEDLVERLIETLKAARQLGNTYIVFTADNGFHLAQQHRLPAGKNSAYEEDIRVPLIVRGPGCLRKQ